MRFAISMLACLIFSTAASAHSVTYTYDSEPGDFIGQGQSATWTDRDGTWTIGRNGAGGVSFDFDQMPGPSTWSLDFAAPGGIELTIGDFPNAERFPFQAANRPGLAVSGEGRGCNTLSGEFSVSEALYDWFREPVRFSATFEQHCEEATPALNGSLEFDLEFGGRAIADDSIVVAFQNRLYEYTIFGQRRQVIPILGNPAAPPALTESARDVAIGRNGRVHVYNGTFDPVLSTGEPATATWRHDTFADWDTVNNLTYGGIATFADFVYVTDMFDGDNGIVRFDSSSGFSAERFEPGTDYIDLNLGLDGFLYALRSDQRTLDFFNPSTMGALGTITLSEDVRAIAINAAGEIFAVPFGATLFHFDRDGNEIKRQITTERFVDLDLRADGTLIAGGEDAAVLVTGEAFGIFTVFNVGSGSAGAFIALPNFSLLFRDGFESGNTNAWTADVQ
ncbi:MAG: hypothetical protein AAF604_13735 [Acidobacteriota bacterium]